MPDVFRKEYKPLSDHQKAAMNEIKNNAEILMKSFDQPNLSINVRHLDLAKTNLKQSVMWAIEAIT